MMKNCEMRMNKTKKSAICRFTLREVSILCGKIQIHSIDVHNCFHLEEYYFESVHTCFEVDTSCSLYFINYDSSELGVSWRLDVTQTI